MLKVFCGIFALVKEPAPQSRPVKHVVGLESEQIRQSPQMLIQALKRIYCRKEIEETSLYQAHD